jgi:MFS family permease
MMQGFLQLLRQQAPLLGFGALLCFTSSAGQTFFIAVFGGAIREAFDLGHGSFGATYSAATLASAVTLIWLGKLVDRVAPARLVLLTVGGLAVAALTMSLTAGVLSLALAFYLLRLFGQGMSTHIAISTLAKRFSAARGRAISIATMGIAVSEVIMPPLAVLMVELGWRWGWRAIAVFLLLVTLPTLLKLLATADRRPVTDEPSIGYTPPPVASRRQGEVLRDWRFWLLMPGLLAGSIITTGIFFHHVHIVAAKGWVLGLFAATFTIYALGSVTSSLTSGWLVDKLGARRPLVFFPLILAWGCLMLASSDSFLAGIAMMILFGVVSGGQSTTVNALWAELYGTAHIGAIRSLAMALMVFGSAVSPIIFGAVFDQGISVEAVAVASAIYAALAGMLFIPALRQPKAQAAPAP